MASTGNPASESAADTTPAALAHGGSLAAARLLFPSAPEPWLDLSTGINPVPYPLPTLPPACFERLPEPADLAALEAVAAQAYGVADPACVVAAPGTQILIDLLPRIFPQRNVGVLGPTYAEHAHAWRKSGASVTETGDIAALGPGCAVICNPNNPDGRRIPPDRVVALADRVGLLVVDEAFADFEEAVSVAPALPHPSLVVLRSFGKTYGLAGLRLGFALASPARAAAIRAALGPWAVSGPAIVAGRAALADAGWRAAAAARLARDAARLDRLLERSSLSLVGGTRLFRLARGEEAARVFARLGQAGIAVRRFADRDALLRFGLPGTDADRRRLETALRG